MLAVLATGDVGTDRPRVAVPATEVVLALEREGYADRLPGLEPLVDAERERDEQSEQEQCRQ